MKKSSFFQFALIAIVCMVLASCKSEVVFTFTLQCSEDFLDFVIPTAVYLDEKGVEQSIELTSNLFTKVTNEEDLVGKGNDSKTPITYEWKQSIRIPGETAQRDMRVSYRLRDNHPEIVESNEYIMKHHLSSTCYISKGLYSGIPKSSNIEFIFTVIVKGEELEEYLQDVIANPDYSMETAK